MLLFAAITLTAIIVAFSYYGSSQVKYLKDHWSELRCNPLYMPLAGYVGVDVSENFIKCTTKSFGDYAGMAMDPLHAQMSLVTDGLGSVTEALGDMRGLFSNVRGGFAMVFQMVFGKIHNLMSSMQYLMIRIRTVMGRIVGVFASIIYAFYAGEQTGESVWNGPIGGAIRMF
jgi:hypothetical protein